MQDYKNLPHTLPIFPLENAIVMPGGHLPLNIFEPRYLNMLQDAVESHRLIGMIQPRNSQSDTKLYDIGCAARISRYEETLDGRLEISLTGLCRFEVKEELTTTRGYRLVIPAWDKFEIDYDLSSELNGPNKAFVNTLKHYFSNTQFELDWQAMENLNQGDLFNSLFYFIDLSSADKQMLLEIDTTEKRIKALTALLSNKDESVIRH